MKRLLEYLFALLFIVTSGYVGYAIFPSWGAQFPFDIDSFWHCSLVGIVFGAFTAFVSLKITTNFLMEKVVEVLGNLLDGPSRSIWNNVGFMVSLFIGMTLAPPIGYLIASDSSGAGLGSAVATLFFSILGSGLLFFFTARDD